MKLADWAKSHKVLILAYAAYIVTFWFLGPWRTDISPATAYVGLVLLHVLFFAWVWMVRRILGK